MAKQKRDVDGATHSRPGSVDQQSEDSFPTSDAPCSNPGAIGAPEKRKTEPLTVESHEVKEAEAKIKSGESKTPHKY